MEKIEKNDQMELEMLREFYYAWVHLHLINRTEKNIDKMKEAAIKLTEQAHVVAEYHKATKD